MEMFERVLRPIKRLLVFAIEAGIPVIGLVLSGLLTSSIVAPDQNSLGAVGAAVFYSGVAVTAGAFLMIRRRTRPWKIEYDALGWMLTEAERKTHPNRARFKRIGKRTLIWIPSTIAAWVLLFFPVATHLVHPSSHYLRRFDVPIPWNFAVFTSKGFPTYGSVLAFGNGRERIGLTPAWFGQHQAWSSEMLFSSIAGDVAMLEFNHTIVESKHTGAREVVKREFRVNGLAFTCWQYVKEYAPGKRVAPPAGERAMWSIDCDTPDVHAPNLYASFVGNEGDIAVFYEIIKGVEPLK